MHALCAIAATGWNRAAAAARSTASGVERWGAGGTTAPPSFAITACVQMPPKAGVSIAAGRRTSSTGSDTAPAARGPPAAAPTATLMLPLPGTAESANVKSATTGV